MRARSPQTNASPLVLRSARIRRTGRTPPLLSKWRKNMKYWRRGAWAFAAVFLACTSSILVRPLKAAESPRPPAGAEFRVGIEKGDIRGADHRALQAAVDYVAGLGGGTVYIGRGRYQM